MRRISSGCRLALVVTLTALASAAQAQQPAPHVGYVYPAGGRQGTEFKVTLGGQFLDGVDKAFISGPGVQAVVLQHVKPLTQKQFNDLRDKFQELQKKKPRDEATARRSPRFARSWPRSSSGRSIRPSPRPSRSRQVGPQRPARHPRAAAHAPTALTNPLSFCVGQLPEFTEAGQGRPRFPSSKKGSRYRMDVTAARPRRSHRDHGAGDGQRPDHARHAWTAIASRPKRASSWSWPPARELIPYLADAVPGWFQAAMALCDAAGQRGGLRRPLPVPSRPGALLRDSRRRRVHAGDPRLASTAAARISSIASPWANCPS